MNYSTFARSAVVALLAVVAMSFGSAGSSVFAASSNSAEVPFGDKVTAVFNYNRTRPGIATAGIIKPGGVGEVKRLGFRTVLDLRTAREGTAKEKVEVSAAGLSYINIEISRAKPTPQQIERFSSIVENPANFPLLVHCASANRVGALWTLYRVSKGISFAEAVIEGRTIGLRKARENQVRAMLGQPALAK